MIGLNQEDLEDLKKKLNGNKSFRVNYDQYKYLYDRGFFKNIINTIKEVLISENDANKRGFNSVFNFCMNYSLKNNNEVIFIYTKNDRQILSDIVKGEEFGATTLFNQQQRENLLKLGKMAHFHTHCNDYTYCFAINDINLITQYEKITDIKIEEYILGLPRLNSIIFLDSNKITKVMKQRLEVFMLKNMELHKYSFQDFYMVEPNGFVRYTKEAIVLNRNQTLSIRKILKPALQIRKWRKKDDRRNK